MKKFFQDLELKVFNFFTKIGILPKELREVDLFIYGFTFILLLITHLDLSLELLNAVMWDYESDSRRSGSITFGVIGLFITAPICIYIALTNKPISKFQKASFQYFIPAFSAVLALSLANHVLTYPSPVNYFLAGWQTFQAILFFIFTGRESVGEFYDIPKRQARRNELFVAVSIILFIVTIAFLNGWYWATTFSVILFIWKIVDGLISKNPILQNFVTSSPIVGKRKVRKVVADNQS